MNFEKPKNPNYCAEIVKLHNSRKHSNADRMQCWEVLGSNVITDLNAKEGDIMVYFPLECQIAEKFLRANNLYRHGNLNEDITQKGYFEDNGRVRAIKLRGEASEGIVLPLTSLSSYVDTNDLTIGDKFDQLGGEILCKKYVVSRRSSGSGNSDGKPKPKFQSKLVEGQFKFHEDTEQFQRSLGGYKPSDFVTVTYKVHGTSGISAHILVKKQLSWKEKLYKWLGLPVEDTEYDYIFSSRNVVKNDRVGLPPTTYEKKEDIWSIAHDELKAKIPLGVTLYYEIVGYMPSGRWIQKNYDYGCEVGNHDIYVYRGTYTGRDGTAIEFSTFQLQAFCKKAGIKPVPLLWCGRLSDVVPYVEPVITDQMIQEHWNTVVANEEVPEEVHRKWVVDNITFNSLSDWRDNVLRVLKHKFTEKDCFLCTTTVPEEGVVVRKEELPPEDWKAHKLKSFRFLQKETEELDSGVENIEDSQQEEEDPVLV